MKNSATQQIYDLITRIYKQVETRYASEPLLLSDFRYYLSCNPLTSETRAELQDRATPSLKSMFATGQNMNDDIVLLHAFRDPIAKIITVFNARLDHLNDPKKALPVPHMDRTLARACFYLQHLPNTFREILNIDSRDENNLARLLNDIEKEIVPEIYRLAPISLIETGNTIEEFNKAFKQLESDFPLKILGTEAIAPRKDYLPTSPSNFAWPGYPLPVIS